MTRAKPTRATATRSVIRPLLPTLGRWVPVHPSDPEVKRLIDRHKHGWLWQTEPIALLGKSGLALVTPQGDAACVWGVDRFTPHGSVRLMLLHNESRRRVWKLLIDACEHAEEAWPAHTRTVWMGRRARSARAKTLTRAGWMLSHELRDRSSAWIDAKRR